jgi:hypothetical protein
LSSHDEKPELSQKRVARNSRFRIVVRKNTGALGATIATGFQILLEKRHC